VIRCVLFDLDGTLVHFEYDDFLKEYFKAITKAVAPLVEPLQFAEALVASTEAMIINGDPSRSNSQVFFEDFFQRVTVPEDILVPVFGDFYANEFTKLKDALGVQPHPKASACWSLCFKKAMMWLLPQMQSFRLRLFWSG
jgi:FMN phosphatase YigB (HAD superfamily)